MTDPTYVYDVADVDLDRHAVIEASAGTGKTYCIENLVVRLLCEKKIPLEKILLVTFTEKATGDLHARIRANVVKAIDEGKSDPKFLREALENFDQASIHTIHGFCQRTLHQYTFENGGRFSMEMVADDALYPVLLRRQQRDEWPADYGEDLESILKLSGYPGTIDADGASSWEARTLDIAKRYNPKAGNTLLPETAQLGSIDELNGRLRTHMDKVAGIVDVQPGDDIPELIQGFSKLPMPPMTLRSCMDKVLLPLADLLRAHAHTPVTVIDFKRFSDGCESYRRFSELGFECLVANVAEHKLDGFGHGVLGHMKGLIAALEAIMTECGIAALGQYLVARTVRRLHEQAEAHKNEQGLMSFNDMLTMMADALDETKNPRAEQMLGQLRNRYQYALVDEFQDTDPVQWEIFKRIFLNSPDHRLLLIGDPKQAIYGFRGADVHTYVQARTTLLQDHDAAFYNLPVNWRSSEGLVNALNQLCGSNAWFSTTPTLSGIQFHPVEVPPHEDRRYKVALDRTKRTPLTIVDLNKQDRTSALARSWMSKFIADEIERLLSDTNLVLCVEGQSRALTPGDVCVLVNRRSEAANLEDFFAAKGIPYTFYKQGGVYESPEATNLFFLFCAILDPGNLSHVQAALLTGAFRFAPNEIADTAPLAPDHPAKKLLQKWHELQAARDWPKLFHSILEESDLIRGEIGRSDSLRHVCNYRHILENLMVAADAKSLNFEQLIDVLRDFRNSPDLLPDNADQQRLATESPKVQIMTIHSSKGLEFPVVFQLGGFTKGPDSPYLDYHDDTGKRVYDLVQSPAGKEAWNAEASMENLRLFYVAATRAICKLYLPKFRPKRLTFAGPLSQFVYSAIEDAFKQTDSPDVRHVDVQGRSLYSDSPVPDSLDPDLPLASQASTQSIAIPEPIVPPIPDLSRRKRVVGSFSSFNLHSHTEKGPNLLELAKAFSDDAEAWERALLDEPDPLGANNDLPAGAATGSMLHDVFERIDFRMADCPGPDHLLKTPEFAEALDEALLAYPIADPERMAEHGRKWKNDVAEMVFNTLNAHLFEDGFRLCHLPPEDRLTEMEFFFPAHKLQDDETDSVQGCITGFIDLVFRRDGTHYLLDWKSNLLPNGYGPDQIETAMTEAGYHLQYQIYSIALCRWLRTVIPDFDPDRDFGGVFYLFLRGTHPTDSKAGVFRRSPQPNEVSDWNSELTMRFASQTV